MSLKTRCPACGTAFKVLPEQLKVSHGWVRCGQCMEVFDAAAAMKTSAPPTTTIVTEAKAAPPAPALIPAPSHRAPAPPPASPPPRRATTLVGAGRAPVATKSPAPQAEPEAASEPAPLSGPDSGAPSQPASVPGPARKRRRPKPEFVRQAEREEIWTQPGMRLALAAMAAALGALLLWQLAWHYRDAMAARWPVTRTLLAAICSGSACQLQAPRALNRITLESGTLVRTAETGVVQLSAGLRNRADFAVQMPALELTLTDELGRVVVRKVLLPQQLVVRPEPMAAQAETAIDVRLAVGDLPLAGFQIDVFYP